MSVERVSTLSGALGAAFVLLLFAPDTMAQGSDIPRTAAGKPDLGGIWQVLNEADWNLEPHGATQGPVESLGAIGAVAPGIGVVEGGKIPYLAAALSRREANREHRRTEDPEAKCFMPGVSPRHLSAVSVPDRAVGHRHHDRVPVRRRRAHHRDEDPPGSASGLLDGLVERPLGRQHSGSGGRRV